MESLAHWLHRLSKIEPSDVERTVLRVFVPGHSVMNFDQWLMTTEQPCRVPPGFRSPFPESVAVLAFLEDKQFSRNAPHQHRLSADIAAAMSLALERRIEIPYEISVRVDGSPTMSFLPYTGIADHTTGGPLPPDAKSLVGDVFSKISGLPDDDLAVIGAATSMLHGAIMLSGEDIRSAYTLLVAGVETLSRKYGAPPTNWDAWELSESWDNFVADFELSPSQTQGLRDRLMNNVQLRLKATFRSYASSRLRPTFWDQDWVEWVYSFELPNAKWGEATISTDGHIRDFLPSDRKLLFRALGATYDLRSSYVHEGRWFGPLELSLNSRALIDSTSPLPFSALRAILRELIFVEMESHSAGGSLPDIKLVREWNPPEGTVR